jgi:hypothetical protein
LLVRIRGRRGLVVEDGFERLLTGKIDVKVLVKVGNQAGSARRLSRRRGLSRHPSV